MKSPKKIFLSFVRSVNHHQVNGLIKLMSEDHLFIDSSGSKIRGKEAMQTGWQGYFSWFPDYQIECSQIFVSGNTVVATGIARGTYTTNGTLLEKNRWEIPPAWRAVIKNQLVQEWQVYADNESVRKIMEGA